MPILLIELFCQSVFFFYGEKKYSILLKPFANKISKNLTAEYRMNWDYKTNKMEPGTYERKGIKYTINSKGFRGKEFGLTTNKKRIITFGGSTTMGLESPDDKTYPAQLELLLNKNVEGYEVLNMGFGSKSLNFIKNLFFTEAYKYNPDIIIIYSNRNSIMYDARYTDLKIDGDKKYIAKVLGNNKLVKLSYFLQENIMTYRALTKTYKRIINLNLDVNYLKSPFGPLGPSEEYLVNGYKNNLIEIIKFSDENNIKVVLVKQAYYFYPEITKEIENFSVSELIEMYRKEKLIKKYDFLNEQENFWIILGTILNKKLDEIKDFKNVIIVNPIPKLLESKLYFTDYNHLTPLGNYVLANEIYKSIK